VKNRSAYPYLWHIVVLGANMLIVSTDKDGVTSRKGSSVSQVGVQSELERRRVRMELSEKQTTLTKRQKEIYEFLKDRIHNRGYGPTVREIGIHFKIRSPNGVMCHLKALEKKGLIHRESNMSRAIGLTEGRPNDTMSLPLIGTATGGERLQTAVSSAETVDFKSIFLGENKACLTVHGSTFSALGICDGDCIIVDRGVQGEPGTLIAALDDQHRLTLCRVQENGRQPIPAVPESSAAATRQILGVVAGVIRNCITVPPAEDDIRE
jgi:repressor LexA